MNDAVPMANIPYQSHAERAQEMMMRKSRRRINWSMSPHREKLARAVDEWFATAAAATTTATNRRVSLGEFAEMHGIPRTTLFKYVREDTSKRQLVRGGDDDGGSVTKPSPDACIVIAGQQQG